MRKMKMFTLVLLCLCTRGRSDQCFRCIHPPPSDLPYELDESEYDELTILFHINCEPLPFAQSMIVRLGDNDPLPVVTFEEWETENYEMTLFTKARGVSTWNFELVRRGSPSEKEKVQVVLGLQRLFSPRAIISFPPPGFVFHRGVGPFWMMNVEEDASNLERLGLGNFQSYGVEEEVLNTKTGESWGRKYHMVSLAYMYDEFPDGEYNLTLTVLDESGKAYPPGSTITFSKDYSTPYHSRTTDTDLTICPSIPSNTNISDSSGSRSACGRCAHGVCLQGACLCEADWFGEACDSDVHDTEIYLPPIDPAGTVWACHQARHFRKGLPHLLLTYADVY